ncbi:unnamed protein product, partial [Mesorhabditis belari]
LAQNCHGLTLNLPITCTSLTEFRPDYASKISTDKYPELLAYQKRIHNIPEIKKWIEKRPQTAL